jgi:hypothetical protein
MLHRDKIAVCSEIRTMHSKILRTWNAQFLYIKLGSKIITGSYRVKDQCTARFNTNNSAFCLDRLVKCSVLLSNKYQLFPQTSFVTGFPNVSALYSLWITHVHNSCGGQGITYKYFSRILYIPKGNGGITEARKLSRLLCHLRVLKIHQALPFSPSCVPEKVGVNQKGVSKIDIPKRNNGTRGQRAKGRYTENEKA